MVSDKGQKLTSAGPSACLWRSPASARCATAGATFNAVADEKLARELVEQRKAEEKAKANAPVTKVSLEDLFSQIQAGEMKNLNLIVKADVQGSVEAVKASLEKPQQRRGSRTCYPRRRGRHQRVRCDAGLYVAGHHRGL